MLSKSNGKSAASKTSRTIHHLLFTTHVLLQICERRPPRVDFALLARAVFVVQVGAALLAEPLAVLAAEVARGEREQDLLAHEIVQVYGVALVEREQQIFGRQL